MRLPIQSYLRCARHHLVLARSITSLVVTALVLGGAVPAQGTPSALAPVAVAVEPAKTTPLSALDTATLAASFEANRIATQGLEAQSNTSRWQTRLGLGALVLSAIAGAAAIAAALYARRAWRENQRSADIAERMLSGYERPVLLLEVVKSGVTRADNSITFDVSQYRFLNLGRVPALIARRHFELVDSVEMPDPIDPEEEIGRPVVYGVAVAANAASAVFETSRALPLHSALRRGRKHRDRKDGERASVYFHGFVEYRDLTGRSWITGFCFVQADNELGFQPLSLAVVGGRDPYNYDRQIV